MRNFYKKVESIWQNFISKPVINKIFLFLPHNIIIFFLFILSIINIINFGSKNVINENVLYNQPISDGVVDPIIVDPVNISFENKEIERTPKKLCLTFATYTRKVSNSDYKFVLYHNDQVIYEEPFNSKILKDGENHCFDISLVDKKNYKEYSASITPIYTDIDNVITIFKNTQTNELTMSILGEEKNICLQIGVIVFFVGVFFILNYLVNTKKISYEKWWLIFAFCYALPIMFIYPPYQVPDEPVHFYNSYMLTQLDISKPLYQSTTAEEFIAPETLDCLGYSKIQVYDRVSDLNDIKECAKNANNKKMPNLYWTTQSKLGYIGNALGIKIGDILTNSPMVIFMMGRLITFLLSVIIIYYAIKITPKYKEIFLTVATIPMFIQEMGSFSYDSLLNSMTLLSIASIMKLIYGEERIKLKYLLLILLSGIFISDIKMIYLPVLLLMLFIPNKKFKKSYYKYICCLGMILLSYIGGNVTKAIFAEGSVAVLDPNNYNLQYVLKHPLFVFEVAWNTLAQKSMFYLRGLVGYFGWFRFRLSDLYVYSYLIYFVYLITNNEIKYENKIDKVIIILGILISVAAIFASMYFGWSADGLNYVEGVQGRYFIPLLIPIMLMFISKKKKSKKSDNNVVESYINIVLLQYILTLLLFYY